MTTSDFRKVLKQLKGKPAVYRKYLKENSPKERSCGIARLKCRRCGRNRAHISKYDLHLCRQCFRKIALDIGFKQFD